MPYITVNQSPCYHQITLEDLLSGNQNVGLVRTNETNTRTYYTDKDGSQLFDSEKLFAAIIALESFVEKNKALYEVPRQSLYNSFKIPKHSGGLRQIDAPLPPLYDALVELRSILTTYCMASYHTAAFAYVSGRSTVDAVKRHQANNSNWFLKVDFHDFFGSTTKEFTLSTLNHIVPFNLICESPRGEKALSQAIDLCFLNGGLPQGTPISPMLTNLLMIPFDYKLSKALRDFNGQQFIYTRYADDSLISSLRDFDPNAIQNLISDVIKECNAPYTFKREKTRYGSRAGSNWNLGVMLNKDNNITVGHKAKKQFRAMCNNYILDSKNHVTWDKSDVQSLQGIISYYKMIEKEYFENLINTINSKYQVNLMSLIKEDLSI